MFMGVPIAFSFAFTGIVGSWIIAGFSPVLNLIGTSTYLMTANYTWTVLPLFMLMGQLAGEAELTGDAYRTARNWVGQLRGGLALATTAASALFAAICGSVLATTITMTKIAWPEMKKINYEPGLSLGSILCAGAVSSLIPPSIAFVIYAMIVEESVGRLFIGGVFPGIVLTITIAITVYIWVRIDPKSGPAAERVPWAERFRSLKKVWSVLLLIIIIMGGIWGGIFTVNEAAGIGATGALIIGMAKRKISRKAFMRALRETALMSGSMFILIVSVNFFNTFLTLTGLPVQLANWVVGMDLSPIMVLTVILLIYVILGIPLEMPPVLLLTLPVFVPLLEGLGIDKVWFGVLSTITISLAAMTPPVGAPLFIVHNLVRDDGIPLSTIFNAAWIYCIPITLTLIICVIFPQLSLWLPATMFGN
jgi:tripartite ATP-independent transporter DctM subunit